jgi:hypothetical protein
MFRIFFQTLKVQHYWHGFSYPNHDHHEYFASSKTLFDASIIVCKHCWFFSSKSSYNSCSISVFSISFSVHIWQYRVFVDCWSFTTCLWLHTVRQTCCIWGLDDDMMPWQEHCKLSIWQFYLILFSNWDRFYKFFIRFAEPMLVSLYSTRN